MIPASHDTASLVAAGKADLVKRFVAAVIDAVVGALIGLIPLVGGILAGGYWLFRDGLDVELMDRRSIGKKLMKLRPVTLDGSPMDPTASAARNWMFAVGGLVALLFWIPLLGWILIIPVALAGLVLGIIEVVLVVADPLGRRMGDRIARTQVVETLD